MDFRKLTQEYQEQFLEDLNALVSCHSTKDKEHAAPNAPFGPGCRQALDALMEIAKRDGFETEDVDGYAGVIRYGQGEESVGVLGHLDIVPLGEGWTKDPLKVTLDDGYLFGRGVLDDKGPLLAGYYALRMIKDLNLPLKRKILVIAGCDEESGMECMDYYNEHGEIPTMGFTPDAEFPAIYGEKGMAAVMLDSDEPSIIKSFDAGTRPNIVIQKAKALVDTKEHHPELFDFYLKTNGLKGTATPTQEGLLLEMEGTLAHGATPYLGNNAGVHLLNYIGQAYEDQLAQDLHELLKDWKGEPCHIYIDGVNMGFLTMNPGIITVKDGHAHVHIDIRFPDDTNETIIMEGFQKACDEKKSAIVPSLKSATKPLFVDPQGELVQGLMASYRKYTGDTFTPPLTQGGGTYAKKFDNFVAFGPNKRLDEVTTSQYVGEAHQNDEGIKLDNLMEAIAIYADALVNLAG